MYQIPKRLSVHEIAEAQEAKDEQKRLAKESRAKQVLQTTLSKQGDLGVSFHEFRPTSPPATPGYKVAKAFQNDNPALLTPGPIWEAWHGTKVANLQSVGQRGLSTKRSRASCLFGAGVYLTRWLPKAMNYGDQRSYQTGVSILTLLKCRVAMGNILDIAQHPEFTKKTMIRQAVGLDRTWQSVFCGSGTRIEYAYHGVVANEEIVVYHDQQVQVQEIYLLVPSDLKAVDPPKQRLGQREVAQLRRVEKDRRSQRDDLVRRHRCVQDGQVCRWATMQSTWSRDLTSGADQRAVVSYCQRFSKQVSPFDDYSKRYRAQLSTLTMRNCDKWSPL